jgi:hypothetical protein
MAFPFLANGCFLIMYVCGYVWEEEEEKNPTPK